MIEFRLQIDPHLVGCIERGFRRCAGMKPVVVDAVGFCDFQNAHPLIDVHGWIAKDRPNQGIMLATQEGFPSVDAELGSIGFELTQAKPNCLCAGMFTCFEFYIQ